jgi:hypothetical protein
MDADNSGNLFGAAVQLWSCASTWNQLWSQQQNASGSVSYLIRHNGDYCLDSLMGRHYDGSPVEVFPCNGDAAQRWTRGPSGQLQSVDSPGYCLDATNWGVTNGTRLQLWRCNF